MATDARALLLALGSLLTVFCTAHIYSSLKPIRAWHNRHVVPVFLLLGLYSGALFAWACAALPGWHTAKADLQVLFVGVMTLAMLCALFKYGYWRHVDRSAVIGAGHATGLESLGTVRSFEQPHTEENYLTHEMGFVLARKHARKLRMIVMLFGFLVPAVLAALALVVPPLQMIAGCLALITGMTGIFVERWLFFAEAKHAVMAYYGR
jgi:DMSO reductase anchor subunit